MNKNTTANLDNKRSDTTTKDSAAPTGSAASNAAASKSPAGDRTAFGNGRQSQGPDGRDMPQQNEKKNKKRWLILGLLLLLLLLLSTCVAIERCSEVPEQDLAPVAVMPALDGNAREIETREELEGAMQQQADANYFTLQINPEVNFSSATGEGTLEIINPSTNVYPISVDLYIDGFEEPVFRSGGIMPNMQITTITAAYDLEPGTYKGTAKVVIYSETDHVKEGETEARILITVG